VSDGELLAGRYRRMSRIGRGGMGEVWLARDELLERRVAIKRLFTGTPDPVSLERMMREARLAARLDHPNAVTVYDVVVADQHPHLIMQYVAGATLDEMIKQALLPPAEAARIIGAVAGALAHAHQLGIVHRDVKPSNILVDEGGRPLLADFGIARANSDAKLTQTGMFIGTPGYLAPEVARGEAATPASDVYALGATLYTAIEGHGPFDDDSGNTLAVLARVLTQPVPPPVRAGGLADLIMAMLAPDPNIRPHPAGAAQYLAGWRGEAARPPDVATTVVRPTPPPRPASVPTIGPTVIRPAVPASDDVVDPISTLIGAHDFAQELTNGWCGPIERWSDLVYDEITPNLRFNDYVDLFVPTLFAIDPELRTGLPRKLVRALAVARAGATLTLPDRLICAWNNGSWSDRHLSVTIDYQNIRQVGEIEYTEAGTDYDAVEIITDSFIWAVLFSRDADLRPLKDLMIGRLRGAVRPEWRDGRVERWLVHDGGSGWRAEPGWPAE
jgi:hypothetical protein